MSLLGRSRQDLPVSTRRQRYWQHHVVSRSDSERWHPADEIWPARWGAICEELPLDRPSRDPLTGELASPARRALPPGIGSPEDRSVHGGRITTLVRDFPSGRDRRIAGLAWDMAPPQEPDPRFGPWGAV
jgi:hypothetical protein